jgi:hypothetical protein
MLSHDKDLVDLGFNKILGSDAAIFFGRIDGLISVLFIIFILYYILL